jgi:hypothetical protein
VGHTDAEGGRDSNIALSEARAEAVRRHLIDVTLGVNPAQLDAAGIGYLAPRATNETAGGREANRRVEVVLLDAEGLSYQSDGPLSRNCSTRKSMKDRTLGWMNRPGG